MKRWGMGVAAAAALAGGQAWADQPGLGNKVYDPYVRNGVTELELRGGRLNGGPLAGESGGVVELEQGLNDRLSLAVVGEFEHHAGERSKLDSVGLEGVAYLGQIPAVGVDVGGYLEYEQRLHAESGVLEGKLLLARQAGPVHLLFNLIARRPLTRHAEARETDFGYAAQAAVDAGSNVQLGVQAFGGLGGDRSLGGRQAHYVGPVVRWEFHPRATPGELELEAAWLLPAGAARGVSDSQLHLVLEYERRF